MSYAIEQFTCTRLGNQVIESYENNNVHELTLDEIKSLTLINRYQSLKNTDKEDKITEIETEFQILYLSVNLSRLVAMKLIIFNPKTKDDNEEKLVPKSTTKKSAVTKSQNQNQNQNKSVIENSEVKEIVKQKLNSDTTELKSLNSQTVKRKVVDDYSDVEPSILVLAGKA